jgi:hypothetical protein
MAHGVMVRVGVAGALSLNCATSSWVDGGALLYEHRSAVISCFLHDAAETLLRYMNPRLPSPSRMPAAAGSVAKYSRTGSGGDRLSCCCTHSRTSGTALDTTIDCTQHGTWGAR